MRQKALPDPLHASSFLKLFPDAQHAESGFQATARHRQRQPRRPMGPLTSKKGLTMAKSGPLFGLVLPNQGVAFGAITVAELIELAEAAEQTGVFESVFVGDSLLAKPRMESVTLLSALAVRTTKVRLGTACMASFPLRNPIVLAAQWGALDNLAEGRTILAACIGAGGPTGGAEGAFQREFQAFGIPPMERAARMEEGIAVLRALWTEESASFHGRFFNFDDITVRPMPVQKPAPPIWIANNPHVFGLREDVLRRSVDRVGRLADGWMTSRAWPDEFRQGWEAVREAAQAHGRGDKLRENCLYHNVNLNDDTELAYAETKRYLDKYYSIDFSREAVDRWSAYGPPERCAENLMGYLDAGVQMLLIRFSSFKQREQLERFVEAVVPLL